jgi:hypothetical protein
VFLPILAAVVGWAQREQQETLEYLREENRILKAQLHGRRLKLTDDERRRLAVLGKRLGRGLLLRRHCPRSHEGHQVRWLSPRS